MDVQTSDVSNTTNASDSNIATIESKASPKDTTAQKRSNTKLWLVFVSICLSVFLSALDQNAVSTALPSIIHDLHGQAFVWVGAAYALSCTAFLPLSGGLAEAFGRRAMMLIVLAFFALGSALCGSAQNMEWLIAARTIQGVGGGGIVSLASIIVSDLVSLEKRGAYNGFLGMTWAVAFAMGPTVGGALTSGGQWRWLFYMNLPICGLAFTMVFFFVNLPIPPGTFVDKMRRIDWVGNILVVGGTTSLVIGMTWGGVQFPWVSAQVLVPLILGVCGLITFFAYETFFAKNPLVPPALLSNISSFSGYLQTFLMPVLCLCVVYYIPVYFQACKDATPILSGVYMLALCFTMGPFNILSSISVTITKRYRPQIWFAWAAMLIGIATFTIVRADTSLGTVLGLLVVIAIGTGVIYAMTYYPVLSPLPVSENAHALALFMFLRLLAGVFGIAIGGSILQNELSHRLPEEFLRSLPDGGSGVDLTFSTIPLVRGLSEPLKTQVRVAFGDSLQVIWKALTAVAALGFLISLLMRDIPLHNVVDEKWTLENNPPTDTVRSSIDKIHDKEKGHDATVHLS